MAPAVKTYFDYCRELSTAAGYEEMYGLQIHAENRLVEWARDVMRKAEPVRFESIKGIFVRPLTLRPEMRQRLMEICLKMPAEMIRKGASR